MSSDRTVGLRVPDESVQASISRTNEDTFTVLTVTSSALDLAKLDAELRAVVSTLHSLSYADVLPDPSEIWSALRGQPKPFAPFKSPTWLTILHPRWYESRTTRELLLAAPCRVEERDGVIWMWTYEDPLHYDTSEAIEAMKQRALYLREHVRS